MPTRPRKPAGAGPRRGRAGGVPGDAAGRTGGLGSAGGVPGDAAGQTDGMGLAGRLAQSRVLRPAGRDLAWRDARRGRLRRGISFARFAAGGWRRTAARTLAREVLLELDRVAARRQTRR